MRTTIELDEELHERMRRQAQREGLSLARLLGRIVAESTSSASDAPPSRSSGRFTVIAQARPGALTKVSAVQKVIDEEGVL